VACRSDFFIMVGSGGGHLCTSSGEGLAVLECARGGSKAECLSEPRDEDCEKPARAPAFQHTIPGLTRQPWIMRTTVPSGMSRSGHRSVDLERRPLLVGWRLRQRHLEDQQVLKQAAAVLLGAGSWP